MVRMNDHQKARRHLGRRDPVMKQLIATVGPCTLQPMTDHFLALASSIISQQISTKAAASIRAKLVANLAPSGLTAAAIVAAADDSLRSAGLSAAKLRALRDLAERVHTGQLQFGDIHALTDEEVIARLLPVRGIGPWTAQMFLMFSLGRPDVLPVADLGLRGGATALRANGLADTGQAGRDCRSLAAVSEHRYLVCLAQPGPGARGQVLNDY